MKLCGAQPEVVDQCPAGKLAFIETISVLDTPPKKFGHDKTIIFFNDSERFDYRNPDALVDYRSGVVCSPNNFAYSKPLEENMMRITALANYDLWRKLSPEEYKREKLRWYEKTLESAARFVPEFRGHVIDVDMFTPLTIERFTGVFAAPFTARPIRNTTARSPLRTCLCAARIRAWSASSARWSPAS